ncbi:unnamed protein product, partial [Pylaiella littoralis]
MRERRDGGRGTQWVRQIRELTRNGLFECRRNSLSLSPALPSSVDQEESGRILTYCEGCSNKVQERPVSETTTSFSRFQSLDGFCIVLSLILTLAHYRRSLARGHKPGTYRARRKKNKNKIYSGVWTMITD